MKIAIDATNLKTGGGLTHLKQISRYFSRFPELEIHIFGGPWIEDIDVPNKHIFEKEFRSIFSQEFFKWFKFKKHLKDFDLVFAPGGSFYSKKIPYVTMCRNMLVFEKKERNRYFFSFTWLRLLALNFLQLRSFKHAEGIIYISNYAKDYMERKYPALNEIKSIVIYHGISDNFRVIPRKQKEMDSFSNLSPVRLLYISIVDVYKHQWNVIEAVKRIRRNGYPISLELIGPLYKPLQRRLKKSLKGSESYISYRGSVNYEEIDKSYKKADMFIFASSCENLPNILIEAMSAGLPIASSYLGPMKEVLGESAVFFNPLEIASIEKAIVKLLDSAELREKLANKTYLKSNEFSWVTTSDRTFKFLKECYRMSP